MLRARNNGTRGAWAASDAQDLFIADVGDISSATYCNPNSSGIRDAVINVRTGAHEFFSRCTVVFRAPICNLLPLAADRSGRARSRGSFTIVDLHIFYIAPLQASIYRHFARMRLIKINSRCKKEDLLTLRKIGLVDITMCDM